jgi:hypothetical protein
LVAAFWRFLNGKDDFALGHVLGPWLLYAAERQKSARFAHTAKAKTQT